MLKINIICTGNLKEKYLKEGIAEFTKRLGTMCKFSITELTECKLPNDPSQAEIEKGLKVEAEKIKQNLSKGGYVIPLCIEGQQLTSEKFANKLNEISVSGKSSVDFIIGSSHGISDEIKKMADFKLSLSKMTFPHQLFRLMLIEQIYRAISIQNGSKYHK